jgi:hypothetical protein
MIQGTPEWRQARCGMASASRISDMLAQGKGNAPSATREDYLYEVVCERITGIPYESFHSAKMDDGTRNEDLARTAYEAKYGVMVIEDGGREHPNIPGFWASPDGLLPPDGGVEIKCPMTKKHVKTVSTGIVDRPYLLQTTGNVMVFSAKWWDFISFDPALPEKLGLYVLRFNRDALPIAEATDGIIQFLRDADALEKQLRARM